MKKFFVAPFCLFLIFSACSKNDSKDADPVSDPNFKGFTASISNPDTKTTINDLAVSWENGDVIYVQSGSSRSLGTAAVAFTTTTAAASATFSCSKEEEAILNYTSFTAFYGLNDGAIPAEYAYNASNVKHLPMFASCGSEKSLTFKNICGVLRITVNDAAAVRKLTVKSEESNLSGKVLVSEGETPAATLMATPTPGNTLTFLAAGNSDAKKVFYVPVVPGSHKLTITTYDSENQQIYTLTTLQAQTIAASTIYDIDFGKLTLDITEAGTYTLQATKRDYIINIKAAIAGTVTINAATGEIQPGNILIDAGGFSVNTLNVTTPSSHVDLQNGSAVDVASITSATTLVLQRFDITGKITLSQGGLTIGGNDGSGDANMSTVAKVVVPQSAEVPSIVVDKNGEITKIDVEGTVTNITAEEDGKIEEINAGENSSISKVENKNENNKPVLNDPDNKVSQYEGGEVLLPQSFVFDENASYSAAVGTTFDPISPTNHMTRAGSGTLTWSCTCTPAGVATIDAATGVLTLAKAGTVDVSVAAAACEGYIAYESAHAYTLTVGSGTQSFTFKDITNSALTKSATDAAFTVAIEGTTHGTLTWDSSDKTVATVSSDGEVTLLKGGSSTKISLEAAGDDDWTSRKIEFTLTVNKANQTIAFSSKPSAAVKFSSTPITSYTATRSVGDGTVTYSSNAASVATVNSSTGAVTMLKTGTVTITATAAETNKYNSASDSYTLTIDKADQTFTVNDVTSGKMTITRDGQNHTLSINGTTYGNVTWESSKTNIATITNDGVVTPVTSGKTTIKAIAAGNDFWNSRTVEFELTIYVPVTSITLDPASITKTWTEIGSNGTSINLSVTVSPEDASDKTYTWTYNEIQDDKNRMSFSNGTLSLGGKHNQESKREATITCTSNDNNSIKATCNVVIQNAIVAVTGIIMNPTSKTLGIGDTFDLSATVEPNDASNKVVSWSSSDENIAKVDQNGKVTAVAAGSCTITATSDADNTKTATCAVTVQAVPVTSISLDPSSITLEKAASYSQQSITPTILPTNATNKSVSWSSNNSSLVSVDTNGNLTIAGNTTGEATITCQAKDGSNVSATCKVTINNKVVKVTGITLKEGSKAISSKSLTIGSSFKLSASLTPAQPTDTSLTWTSSKPSIATVEGGVVTAVAVGETTITCKANGGDNVTATCTVTVTPIYVTGITLSATKINLVGNNKSTLLEVTKIEPENATIKNVKWEISGNGTLSGTDNDKRTVNITGNGNNPKSCTVTCTADDGNPNPVTAKCTINWTKS